MSDPVYSDFTNFAVKLHIQAFDPDCSINFSESHIPFRNNLFLPKLSRVHFLPFDFLFRDPEFILVKDCHLYIVFSDNSTRDPYPKVLPQVTQPCP